MGRGYLHDPSGARGPRDAQVGASEWLPVGLAAGRTAAAATPRYSSGRERMAARGTRILARSQPRAGPPRHSSGHGRTAARATRGRAGSWRSAETSRCSSGRVRMAARGTRLRARSSRARGPQDTQVGMGERPVGRGRATQRRAATSRHSSGRVPNGCPCNWRTCKIWRSAGTSRRSSGRERMAARGMRLRARPQPKRSPRGAQVGASEWLPVGALDTLVFSPPTRDTRVGACEWLPEAVDEDKRECAAEAGSGLGSIFASFVFGCSLRSLIK